jgi:hypothetical protein
LIDVKLLRMNVNMRLPTRAITAILDVASDGSAFLRDEVGRPINQGVFRNRG